MPRLHKLLDRYQNRAKPAWYRDLPPTFNWKDGHPEYRRGDFKRAFKKYSRSLEYIDKESLTLPDLRRSGITLALFGGLGDSIQFLRFAKLLHEKGVRVTLRIEQKYKPLEELFSSQPYIAGVVHQKQDGVPEIYLKSVPYLLNIGLPDLPTGEYLTVSPDRVNDIAERTAGDRKFKIGVQFESAKKKGVDLMNRDLDISLFKRLPLADVSLYSLERDALRDKKGVPLIELGESRSIVDAAAIMKCMDLVIVPATMVSNLAGAIGVPVWTLLPHPCPSWRYFLDEKSMPWYPTMTLFRQSTKKDWAEVFDRVSAELRKML